MYEAQSPLGVFNLLRDAASANRQAVKEASARGTLPVTGSGQDKQASAQASNETDASARLQFLLNSAAADEIAAEKIAMQLQKGASVNGPGAGQPASDLGPRNNENNEISRGQYQPSESRKYKTGRTGFENDGFGSNHIETDENSKQNLGYTASSSALPTKSASAKAARDWLKEMAKVADRGEGPTHQVGSSGIAAGQPASSIGPRDDEDRKLNHRESDSNRTIGKSPWDVGHTNAQDVEGRAKANEFPLSEPQSHDLNAESGWGSGPTSSAYRGPEPNKTASALRQKLAYVANLHKLAAEKCKKCDSKDCKCEKCKDCGKKGDCKCSPKSEKKPPTKAPNDKKSMGMDMGADAGM